MASSWPTAPPTMPTSRLSSCMSGSLPQCLWNRSEGGIDELRALNIRNNPPSIVFDNVSDERSTLVKVGSANRHGCLLEVVQLLTDLNLYISKAFISSDAGWFVDVFHVRDSAGEKLRDRRLMAYIQQALGAPSFEEVAPSPSASRSLLSDSARSARPSAPHLPAAPHHAHAPQGIPTRSISAIQTLSAVPPSGTLTSSAASAASASSSAAAAAAAAALNPGAAAGAAPPAASCLAPAAHTTIEITGCDRPGILANVASVLAAAQCNVVGAEVWTHNGRVACVVCVTDNTAGGGRIKDPLRLQRIRADLAAVVRPGAAGAEAEAAASSTGVRSTAAAPACLLPSAAPTVFAPALVSASPTSSLSPGISPPHRAALPPLPATAHAPHRLPHPISAAPPHADTSPAAIAALGGTWSGVYDSRGAAAVEARRQTEGPAAAMHTGVQGADGAQAGAAGGGVWTDVEWDSVGWDGGMREMGRGVESTSLPVTMAHAERRLHQLLFADRDYEENSAPAVSAAASTPAAASFSLASGGGGGGGASDRGGAVRGGESGRQRAEEGRAGSQLVQGVPITRQGLMPPPSLTHSASHPVLSPSALLPQAAAAAVPSPPPSLPSALPPASPIHTMPLHASRPTVGSGLTITAPMGWAASGLSSQVVSTEPDTELYASGAGRQACVGAAGVGSGGAWVGGRLMGSRSPATGRLVGRRGRRGAGTSTSGTGSGLCSSGGGGSGSDGGGGSGVRVSVRNSVERQYSVVRVRCLDRPKLLFDTVCTLTDMGYMVHHGAINSHKEWAMQEYFIRQMDGSTLETEAERQRVIKCVEAAIERRTPKGVHLELCVGDRAGLLSDVTRLLLSQNLSVAAANVSTRGSTAVDEFIIADSSGRPVDVPRVLAAVRQHMGPQAQVTVKGVTEGAEGEEAAGDGSGSGKNVSAVAGGSGALVSHQQGLGMHRSHSCGWQSGWGGRGAGSGASRALGDRQVGGSKEGEGAGVDVFGLPEEDDDEGWGEGVSMFGNDEGDEGGDGGDGGEEGEPSSILGAVWRQSEWLLSSLGFRTKA